MEMMNSVGFVASFEGDDKEMGDFVLGVKDGFGVFGWS